MRSRHIPEILALVLFAGSIYGLDATIDGSASTGARFLNIPVSARFTAMGNAGTALASGAEAVFVNPAGSYKNGNGFTASHDSWLDGAFIENAAVNYLPFKDMAFGMALSYVNSGSIDVYKTDANGNPVKQGQISANDFIVKGNYSLNLPGYLSAGLNIGCAVENLGQEVYAAFVTDLGLNYVNENGFSAGLTAKNMGTRIGKYDMSVPLNAGISYSKTFSEVHTLTGAAECRADFRSTAIYGAGVEYAYKGTYFIRTGYSTDNTGSTTGLSGLRAGAGVKFERITLDYAFEPYGKLGISNKISFAMAY